MKDTQKLLLEGHPDRAVGRLATLLETHPDKMRELTNAMGAFLIQCYRQCRPIGESEEEARDQKTIPWAHAPTAARNLAWSIFA